MDSKGRHTTKTKGLSKKAWFWIRMTAVAVIVFVLWWFLAPLYVAMVKGFVSSLIQAAGFYISKEPKLTDALMSPVIPFVILMIGTWGTKLVVKDGKPNWKLFIWFATIAALLLLFSMFGQFLAVYMMTASIESPLLVFVTGFLIATGPVLIPVVAWLGLSHKQLRDIFLVKA